MALVYYFNSPTSASCHATFLLGWEGGGWVGACCMPDVFSDSNQKNGPVQFDGFRQCQSAFESGKIASDGAQRTDNLGTQVLMARDRWDEQTPPANGVSFFSFFLSL